MTTSTVAEPAMGITIQDGPEKTTAWRTPQEILQVTLTAFLWRLAVYYFGLPSDNIVELSELEEGRAETTVAVADPSTAEIRGVEENTS